MTIRISGAGAHPRPWQLSSKTTGHPASAGIGWIGLRHASVWLGVAGCGSFCSNPLRERRWEQNRSGWVWLEVFRPSKGMAMGTEQKGSDQTGLAKEWIPFYSKPHVLFQTPLGSLLQIKGLDKPKTVAVTGLSGLRLLGCHCKKGVLSTQAHVIQGAKSRYPPKYIRQC